MRGGLHFLLVPALAACAGGAGRASGSVGTATFGSGTTAGTSDGSTSSSAEAESTTAAASSTTSETGSTSGDTTLAGTSSDTGEPLPCDELLESFAADPGWTALGLPDGGNVFAWSGTANAGGAPGELGGTLQRSGNDQHLADTTIVAVVGDCVAASGRLVATMEDSDYNSVVSFGHFGAGGGAPFIGFSLGEGSDATLRVYMQAGGFSEQTFLMEDIATPRAWSYLYDPVAASMTLTMDGLGSVTRPLGPDDVGDIAGIDAFGLFKTPHDTPDAYTGLLGLYLDEIAYTR